MGFFLSPPNSPISCQGFDNVLWILEEWDMTWYHPRWGINMTLVEADALITTRHTRELFGIGFPLPGPLGCFPTFFQWLRCASGTFFCQCHLTSSEEVSHHNDLGLPGNLGGPSAHLVPAVTSLQLGLPSELNLQVKNSNLGNHKNYKNYLKI